MSRHISLSARASAFAEFGLTHDPAELARVKAWREAAIVDGWESKPTYSNEPESSAATLNREGWAVQVIAREKTPGSASYLYEAKISAWAPDRLTVEPGKEYSMAALLKAARTCGNCGKEVERTLRYSFAGRCCAECLPAMQRIHEYPGWNR